MVVEPERPYPVSIEGELDPTLSRWLWLVKWLLAIPHYIILFFLGIAFFIMTIVTFFAMEIFDFNIGVLRWYWRVAYYSYSALGTDRYPPFSLERRDYPANLEVEYPERLSRGLVLVKWWLLAIPQYLIISVFEGGWGGWMTMYNDAPNSQGGWGFNSPGLIFLLVLFAAIALLFTGRYPGNIFNLLLGLNR